MSAYIGILRTKIISVGGSRYKGVRLKRISTNFLVLNLIWKFAYDS